MILTWLLASQASLAGDPINDIQNTFAPSFNWYVRATHNEQFKDIQAAGFDVVVNLAMPDSDNALTNEGAVVSENGMTYVHIPVPWDAPDANHIAQFLG